VTSPGRKELAIASVAEGPRRAAQRKQAAILYALVLGAVLFNAVAMFGELRASLPSLNDDAVHYLLIQRASAALQSGENPFDHWLPEIELGFPEFFYYQHLPHLTVVLLHRLLLKPVSLLTLFNLVRYLLLVTFPLTVFWSMRRMDFPITAACIAAATSSFFSTWKGYGFEYGSYTWGGLGMYTQLWAMHLSFISLAFLYRVQEHGRGYVGAVVSCSALVLSHLIYTYMMAIAGLVLFLNGVWSARKA
jgi:uncharacterized membrane protein